MVNKEEQDSNMRQRGIEMDMKYQELLILAYFKSHYKKYEFNEILKIMGMTYAELKNAIERLFDTNYLIYYGNYIVVTKLGEDILKEIRLENFFSDKVRESKQKKQWDIDEPYVPIGFKI